MRGWLALSAKLYPRPWRERYGPEFDALMEDVEPDWCELVNVLGGALKMQMRTETAYLKLAAVMAGIGGIVALGVSLRIPERYTSSAVLQVTTQGSNEPDKDRIEVIEQEILSRSSLAEMIQRPSFDLYRGERTRVPMEDVIQQMRRDIQMVQTGGVVNIAFTYPDREVARRVVGELAAKLTETNQSVNRNRQWAWRNLWQEDAPAGMAIAVVAPASDGRGMGHAERPWLLAAGVLLGALLAAVWRWPRVAWRLAAFAAAGSIVAGAISYLIPSRYTSTAEMRIVPPLDPKRWYASRPPEPFADRFPRIREQFLSDFKNECARMPIPGVVDKMLDRDVRIEPVPPSGFRISFTYGDPLIAQAVVRALVTRTVEGYVTEARYRATTEGGEFKRMEEFRVGEIVEVLDPASLPQAPIYPNRLVIAAIGLTAGLLLGGTVLLLRRPPGTPPHTVPALAA